MTQLYRKTIYETLGREPVHPFPARMAPGIALQIISRAKKPLRILDPMMGSGTVIALARLRKHKAIGVDADPLAFLISKVWATSVDIEAIRAKAREVLRRARQLFSKLPLKDAYPRGSDPETRAFVSYWFDPYARRQLAALSLAVGRVRDENIRNVLLCALSRLIITKSSGASLARDLSHSRPHKSFNRAPIKPFRKFLVAVERVATNCLNKKHLGRGPAPRVLLGDARKLPVQDGSIHLVLTSPPYLNAIDYIRCSKFSLVWMGYRIPDLRQLRRELVGSGLGENSARNDSEISRIISNLNLNPKLTRREEAALASYIEDMRCAMREVVRVLTPKGKAVYVIGENTIRGTYIRNSVILCALAAACGLKLQERRARTLPANRRYLPPPSRVGGSAALDIRMRREVILQFIKRARGRSASRRGQISK